MLVRLLASGPSYATLAHGEQHACVALAKGSFIR